VALEVTVLQKNQRVHSVPLSEITELKYTSLIKMIILEENFKWHLEGFASEFFKYTLMHLIIWSTVL